MNFSQPRTQKSERQNPWQQTEHARLYFDVLQALTWRIFDSAGFLADGTMIFKSVVPSN